MRNYYERVQCCVCTLLFVCWCIALHMYLLQVLMDHFFCPPFGAREEQRVRVHRIEALSLRRKSKACSDKRIDIDLILT